MNLEPPKNLRREPPQATFRYIATWAENAADLYDELDSEYDWGSDRAVAIRSKWLIECCAHIFAAIMLGQGDAKFRLARGLSQAQQHIHPDEILPDVEDVDDDYIPPSP